MIDELGELRRFNSYVTTMILRNRGCDPDVAVIAAWWVLHNKPPKKWSKHMQTSLHKIVELKTKQNEIPEISDRIFKIIMDHYRQNKLHGLSYSLLPPLV